MNSNEIEQLTTLIGSQENGGGLLGIESAIQAIMPFIIIFAIVTIILAILYGLSIIQRMRTDRAILEIRDMLKEMKLSRPLDKVAEAPAPTRVLTPSSTDTPSGSSEQR